MSDLADLCGGWLGEERERFYDALDSLPIGDAQDIAADALEEWQRLAGAVGSRSQAQVHEFAQREYEQLTNDPELAELQKIGIEDSFGGFDDELTHELSGLVGGGARATPGKNGKGQGGSGPSSAPGAAPPADAKDKKRERGLAWSEQEHKLFLVGLERFGKGDWRSISRQCVITRTPAQVASHAQKYFLRQDGKADGRPGRRVSIHDISCVEDTLPPRNQRKRQRGPATGKNGGKDGPDEQESAANATALSQLIGAGAAVEGVEVERRLHAAVAANSTLGGAALPSAPPAVDAQRRTAPVPSAAPRSAPALQWAPVQYLPSGPARSR